MRLLIAGWHGQIARALADLAPARPEISAMAIGRPALDLCNKPTIRRSLIETVPDVVINTAAYTEVDKAESEPEAVFQLNCDGAAALADAAAKKDIPVIQLSTDYVFDGTKTDPYTEEDDPAPKSVYGRSKLCGEQEVAKANPKHIILRTAWVYSSHGRNFVTTILRRAGERSQIEVVDDQVGSPTYALSVAEIILDIAIRIASNHEDVPWGVYHATSSGSVSWCGFARKVLDISRELGGPSAEISPIRTGAYPTLAPRLSNARLDSSKLDRVFGIRMPEWSEGVEDCVRRLLSSDEIGDKSTNKSITGHSDRGV